jgi:enoyl-CoA hydratase/carnithine racemase
MTEHPEIRYTVDDPVAEVRLARPAALNALTLPMLAALRDALFEAERDARVVGIVLTGEGRGFCSGLDMRLLQRAAAEDERSGGQPSTPAPPPAAPAAPAQLGPDVAFEFDYFPGLRKPIVAAVNGPAAGLGFVLAMLCDIRIAGERAVFNSAFAARGLVAEYGISWLLPRLVGTAHALDVLWRPRKIDAREALGIGLVSRVVTDAELVSTASAYVRELAERSSPASLMAMKAQVYRDLSSTLAESWVRTREMMAKSVEEPDFREGVTAFVESRPPRFRRIGE